MKIIITCYDTELKKWIMPDKSGQTSSSMPIEQAFEKDSDDPKELIYTGGDRFKFFVKIKD
jgi:hypothetical protein